MPNIVAAVIAFSIMILVHELGHFLMAKRVGITVYAFAIGFGPRVVGFRRGETTYAINALPFGGYVRMAGEDLDEAGGAGSFRSMSVWQRMTVVVAGPAMNLLLALLLLMSTALIVGVPTGVSNRIGQLMPGWPAEQVGLRPGDAIVAIDGEPMDSGQEVIDTIHARPNQELHLTVERDGRRFEVTVRSRLDPDQRIGLIGFRPEAIREHMGPLRALAWAAGTVGETVDVIFTTLVGLVRQGRGVFDQLAGPVGAVRFLGEAGAAGAEIFVYTAAALSIMIGIFNLLPFPALDGGRLLFLLVEAVRRRPVDPRREGYIHLVGFALLLLLLLTLTVRDIGRL
ncbi:MAG: M50 family metallopeptidase [Armatimonadota bacterium]|nr:M50 family metallopeptidase [Armatimonadota bacterium]MDR7451580.1 M50 family metallopeptidase [Armatimonadota bacterium]MDR7467700.1 M50 family metallopeptidase [Armatimonadota bacterium]MDR7492549.1 M50 family metallopeptidase [Armatimonadota bacterium]MDR7500577.1 M50 family metallopeptidase [Armatimonadota bacterium]